MSDRVLAIGVSVPTIEAIVNRGLLFDLVADPAEDVSRTPHAPHRLFRRPYRDVPTAALDIPRAEYRAVISTTERGLLPAALYALHTGLPGLSLSAVLQSRSKFLMRQALESSAVFPLQYGMEEQASELPFRRIVKPVDGAGGVGIELVLEDEGYAPSTGPHYWETWVDGEEYCIDTISFEGEHVPLGIVAKQKASLPKFDELTHAYPAHLREASKRRILETVVQALDAIGHRTGASHTEVKEANGVVSVIETQTRPGGDHIPRIMKIANGVDEYAMLIEAHLGISPLDEARSALASTHKTTAVVHLASAELSTRPQLLKEVDQFSSLLAVEHVAPMSSAATDEGRGAHVFFSAEDTELLYEEVLAFGILAGRSTRIASWISPVHESV